MMAWEKGPGPLLLSGQMFKNVYTTTKYTFVEV